MVPSSNQQMDLAWSWTCTGPLVGQPTNGSATEFIGIQSVGDMTIGTCLLELLLLYNNLIVQASACLQPRQLLEHWLWRLHQQQPQPSLDGRQTPTLPLALAAQMWMSMGPSQLHD